MNKKYLLSDKNLNKIKTRINTAENVLFFLDYDGTLAPFKKDPLQAYALPTIETDLKRLEQNNKCYLSLVSGRKLSQLKQMINLAESNYAGSHGLEIELFFAEDIVYPNQNRAADNLSKKKYQEIKTKFLGTNDIRLEDKGFGLALHFASAKKQSTVKKKLKSLFDDTSYQVLVGRKIIEIRPDGWNKGKAVNYITNQLTAKFNLDNFIRIYIGDDRTDEDAFEKMKQGIAIYVQNNDDLNTKADYYLNDPAETANFLNIIAGEI